MYARHVSFNLKPIKREEVIQIFEKDILPLLQQQDGFTDEMTFFSPDAKDGIAISLWDRKENADRYNRETYPQVLKGLAKVVDGTPAVHAYEVGNSTWHKIAAAF